jgi:hypothetical protein
MGIAWFTFLVEEGIWADHASSGRSKSRSKMLRKQCLVLSLVLVVSSAQWLVEGRQDLGSYRF